MEMLEREMKEEKRREERTEVEKILIHEFQKER